MVPCVGVSSFQRIRKIKVENVFFVADLVRQILNKSSVIKAGDKLMKMFMWGK